MIQNVVCVSYPPLSDPLMYAAHRVYEIVMRMVEGGRRRQFKHQQPTHSRNFSIENNYLPIKMLQI